MQGLEKREEGIARQIAETKAANEEAKRMLASYERRLAEASDEVRGMLEEARRDADTTRQSIVAEARKAAEDERNRAKHEIQLAKDDALSQIAEKAGHLAVEVAGQVSPRQTRHRRPGPARPGVGGRASRAGRASTEHDRVATDASVTSR